MALYKVNTGCREQEVCQLRWAWEVEVPEIGTSLFILPNNDQFETKNSQERIVVLNAIARRIVDEQRGRHRKFVFSYKGDRLYNMLNSAWRKARVRAGLPDVWGARPSAHVRASTAGRRSELRGSSGFARAQVRAHNDALPGSGHCAVARICREGVHTTSEHCVADRCPHESRPIARTKEQRSSETATKD
jgi:integrase